MNCTNSYMGPLLQYHPMTKTITIKVDRFKMSTSLIFFLTMKIVSAVLGPLPE